MLAGLVPNFRIRVRVLGAVHVEPDRILGTKRLREKYILFQVEVVPAAIHDSFWYQRTCLAISDIERMRDSLA